MIGPVLAFFVSLACAILLTPLVIRFAERFGAVDHPGERKVHDHPIPRAGGVVIYATLGIVGVAALLLGGSIRSSLTDNFSFWLSFGVGVTLVFLLGLYDDIRHASVGVKFAVQFAAAALVIAWGGVRFERLALPLVGSMDLGWLWFALTLLWIVGVTNAFNLIDGLDGLAGGLAFISTVTLFAVSLVMGGRVRMVFVLAVLSGALLGFLRYNRNPARIFLGDSGSMMLGYMLAVLSVVGSAKRTTALALLIPIMIVGVPVFDTLYAMGRRLTRKIVVERDWKPSALGAMFTADREHIHHALMDTGFTHGRTVLVLYGLSLVLGLLAFTAAIANDDRVSFVLMLAGIAGFMLVKYFGWYKLLADRPGNGGDPQI